MDPVIVLLDILIRVLKEAVPEAGGRVYLRRAIPRNVREVKFIQVSLGEEQVEQHDITPPMLRRRRTITLTPVVRGDTEQAYRDLLLIRLSIAAVMREVQMVPAMAEGEPCLVDEIRPAGESEVEITGTGDKFYTGLSMAYEAEYVTEEGTPGLAGPGVPSQNVLTIFETAAAEWRRGQVTAAADTLTMPGEEDHG